jgi:hypothetical protein
MADQNDNGNDASPTASWTTPPVLVGIGVLLVFVGLVGWAMAARNDLGWDHIVYIFGSVEAIAFAAAGAIFGTQVQRSQTQAAQQQVTEERSRADEAQANAQRHSQHAGEAIALALGVRAAVRQGVDVLGPFDRRGVASRGALHPGQLDWTGTTAPFALAHLQEHGEQG